MEKLPCGCEIGNTPGGEFVFKPHALDCEFYLFALAETERQGKSIEFVQEN